MKGNDLLWTVSRTESVWNCPVFTIKEKESRPPDGKSGRYYGIDAPDWAVVMPVIGTDFLLVRQWRHGMEGITLEFPGGVVEKGEDPMQTALRETEEEIAFRAGSIRKLGEVNPNPALFSNRCHFFLAEDLTPLGEQKLDEDERIRICRVPIRDVIRDFGTGEYLHAFMGTALALYERHCRESAKEYSPSLR